MKELSVATPMPTSPSRSFGGWLSRHWFEIFIVMYGLWVWLPFLAPVFMNIGWTAAGKAIYFAYSFFCHQLPERSFFLFGQKVMYSLPEIQAAWQDTINPFFLRQFIGNDLMGWKIAWSDRMISFYTSVWLFAIAWWLIRNRVKPLKWWGLVLFLLPILVDGSTHMISDLSGIGQGFRDTNQWLSILTGNFLRVSFYSGDALGSFNSWARLISGLLAGPGIVWFVFPYVFQSQAIEARLRSEP